VNTTIENIAQINTSWIKVETKVLNKDIFNITRIQLSSKSDNESLTWPGNYWSFEF
jgi:hypothetical protein